MIAFSLPTKIIGTHKFSNPTINLDTGSLLDIYNNVYDNREKIQDLLETMEGSQITMFCVGDVIDMDDKVKKTCKTYYNSIDEKKTECTFTIIVNVECDIYGDGKILISFSNINNNLHTKKYKLNDIKRFYLLM